MNIHLEDFAWLRQGKFQRNLVQAEAHYLYPIKKIQSKSSHRAIILLHGFSSSPAVFRTLISHLSAYDAVIIPLLPGHGENLKVFSQVHADDWMNATQNNYLKIKQQYEFVDVMGLSLGGLLATMLAQNFKVDHLFLLAPALALKFPMSLGPMIPRFLSRLGFKSLRSQGGNLCCANESELVYRRLPWTSVAEILELVYDFRWQHLQTSIDLMLGKNDIVIANARVQEMMMGQENLFVHCLENSAHILPLDNDQDKIIQILKQHQQSKGF